MPTDTLPYVEVGNPKGPPLVLLSGFPDDNLCTFNPLINNLKEEYRIVSCCFPDNQLTGNDIHKAKAWGWYNCIFVSAYL
jgi:hypothetical protein